MRGNVNWDILYKKVIFSKKWEKENRKRKKIEKKIDQEQGISKDVIKEEEKSIEMVPPNVQKYTGYRKIYD